MVSFPDHCSDEFSKYQWIEDNARKEIGVIQPLGEWFSNGNHCYEDLPPGIRTEIFYKDEKNGIFHPSAHWLAWGFTGDDMSGLRWLDRIHPDDRSFLRNRFHEYKTESQTVLTQSVYRVSDYYGVYHWILSSSVAIKRSEDGELFLYIGRDVEIGSRIEREIYLQKEIVAIEAQSARDKALMEAAGFIAGVTDIDALQIAVDDAALRILNMNDFRFILINGSDVRVLTGADIPREVDIRRIIETVEHIGKTELSESFVVWPMGVTAEGQAVGMFHRLPGYTDDIEPIMVVLIPIIFQAWRQVTRVEQLRLHAATDPLTNVWNRRAFLQQAGLSLRDCIGKKHSATLVIYDIDHFKHVNDVFGHPYGDEILVLTAEAMNNALRSEDLMCRWGGEEFVLYLEGVEGDEALVIAERIRSSAEEATLGEKISITLSAGLWTIAPDNPETLEKALKKADSALLRAKQEGRNRICLYEEDKSSSGIII